MQNPVWIYLVCVHARVKKKKTCLIRRPLTVGQHFSINPEVRRYPLFYVRFHIYSAPSVFVLRASVRNSWCDCVIFTFANQKKRTSLERKRQNRRDYTTTVGRISVRILVDVFFFET